MYFYMVFTGFSLEPKQTVPDCAAGAFFKRGRVWRVGRFGVWWLVWLGFGVWLYDRCHPKAFSTQIGGGGGGGIVASKVASR